MQACRVAGCGLPADYALSGGVLLCASHFACARCSKRFIAPGGTEKTRQNAHSASRSEDVNGEQEAYASSPSLLRKGEEMELVCAMCLQKIQVQLQQQQQQKREEGNSVLRGDNETEANGMKSVGATTSGAKTGNGVSATPTVFCSACKKSVAPGSRYVQLMLDDVSDASDESPGKCGFHPECLRCAKCAKQLDTTSIFRLTPKSSSTHGSANADALSTDQSLALLACLSCVKAQPARPAAASVGASAPAMSTPALHAGDCTANSASSASASIVSTASTTLPEKSNKSDRPTRKTSNEPAGYYHAIPRCLSARQPMNPMPAPKQAAEESKYVQVTLSPLIPVPSNATNPATVQHHNTANATYARFPPRASMDDAVTGSHGWRRGTKSKLKINGAHVIGHGENMLGTFRPGFSANTENPVSAVLDTKNPVHNGAEEASRRDFRSNTGITALDELFPRTAPLKCSTDSLWEECPLDFDGRKVRSSLTAEIIPDARVASSGVDTFNLRWDSDDPTKVHAATLNKLIEHLTPPKSEHLDFQKHFLMTFSSFCSSQQLIDKLRERFDVPCGSDIRMAQITKTIQLRVCNVVKRWIEQPGFFDWDDLALVSSIRSFAEQISTVHANVALTLSKSIDKCSGQFSANVVNGNAVPPDQPNSRNFAQRLESHMQTRHHFATAPPPPLVRQSTYISTAVHSERRASDKVSDEASDEATGESSDEISDEANDKWDPGSSFLPELAGGFRTDDMSTRTTNQSVWRVPVLEIARQMTLIDHGLYWAVRPADLLREDSRRLSACIRRFNVVAQWAAFSIINAESLEERAHRLRVLIEVAHLCAFFDPRVAHKTTLAARRRPNKKITSKKLLGTFRNLTSSSDKRKDGAVDFDDLEVSEAEIRELEDVKIAVASREQLAGTEDGVALYNFSTAVAIVAGINNAAVQRMKRTMEACFEIAPHKNGDNHDFGRYRFMLTELEELASGAGSFKKYRDCLKKARPPAVPYFGVHMGDLTFVKDGNPDKIVVQGGDGSEVTLINFTKRRMYASVIMECLQFQNPVYNLVRVPWIADDLLSTRRLPTALHPNGIGVINNISTDLVDSPKASDRVLFDLSLLREPRQVT